MRFSLAAAALVAGLLCSTAPAFAQSDLPLRVDRLEKEMSAVQRKVFPGGAGRNYVEPQITPEAAPETPAYGAPSSSPLSDLTSRVGALEQQMTSLTNSVEETQHRLQMLQDDFRNYKQITDQRLAKLEGGAPGAGGGFGAAPGAPTGGQGPSQPPIDANAADAINTSPAGADATAPGAAPGDIQKPDSGDPEEDAYIYGYRLWTAKQYPAAEAQLKKVIAQYPDTRRWSYAQNLLGRSYLDDGKPALASMAFYDNYKKMPDGERAPDSLYYLAQSLIELKKPADACKVYDELTDVYGDKLSAAMKANVAQGRITAQCK